tara:strand:- start:8 stop:226 length:219 start_codon:yes stop_codon:yes gene_type:complete
MDTTDWKRKADFYKKQLDDLKISRFTLLDDLKKKDIEIEKQKNMRKKYYRKMTEFKNECLFLLNKKFEDINE